MIELNDELKKFLSQKYNLDKKLIYSFQYEDLKKQYKMVYHVFPNTYVRYIDPKEIRNFTLRLKLQKLLNTIKIKKQ